MILVTFALLLSLSAVSYWLTGVARTHAIRKQIFDRPNHRSSHTVATPRGGGIGFAVVVLIGLAVLGIVTPELRSLCLALLGGGGLLAATGWIDDRRSLRARTRLGIQILSATWAVVWIGGMPSLSFGSADLSLGACGAVVAVLGIVWMTNLYNFMDGIDGLAATQLMTVGSIAGLLYWFTGHGSHALLIGLIVFSVAGFLPWNWSPARIFMGDCGSGLLGFLFGALMIDSERIGATPILAWCILMGVFLVDATATLLRRVTHGEKWYEAHRSHAYQRAVQAGYSHPRVTTSIALVNLLLGGVATIGTIARPWLVSLAFAACAALLMCWNRMRRLPPAIPAASQAQRQAA